jgi:hypothetical protein
MINLDLRPADIARSGIKADNENVPKADGLKTLSLKNLSELSFISKHRRPGVIGTIIATIGTV